jgi:hypothetical protein
MKLVKHEKSRVMNCDFNVLLHAKAGTNLQAGRETGHNYWDCDPEY